MKLEPIEKQIIGAIVILIILLTISMTCLVKSLDKMQQNGGLKAAVNEIWNGTTNSATTNKSTEIVK